MPTTHRRLYRVGSGDQDVCVIIYGFNDAYGGIDPTENLRG